MAPDLAARSSALSAAARAATGSPSSEPAATLTAFVVRVFAALRRGWLISARRSAVRTRFRADGVLAPVQPRGLVAKSEPQVCDEMGARPRRARRGTPRVAEGPADDQRVEVPRRAVRSGTLRPMIPILGGLCAALAFTVSVLVSARASRLTGARVDPGRGDGPRPGDHPAGGDRHRARAGARRSRHSPGRRVSGVGNVVGLLLIYTAYRIGAVGIISTIASTEGAISAVLSVLAGEVLQPGSGPVLGVVALGVALAAAGGREEEEGVEIPRARSIRAAALSIAAALSFGLGLYASGRISGLLPVAWAILPARVAGVLIVAIPLAVTGRVRISRAAAPYVAATGLAEIVGYVAYVVGARDGIAVASVLTSMFAPFATLAAFVLFRERLGRREVVGIGLVASGVIVLGVLQS